MDMKTHILMKISCQIGASILKCSLHVLFILLLE